MFRWRWSGESIATSGADGELAHFRRMRFYADGVASRPAILVVWPVGDHVLRPNVVGHSLRNFRHLIDSLGEICHPAGALGQVLQRLPALAFESASR